MARKRKTQTGADALPVQSVSGRRYGEGPESAALQRSLPAPAAATPAPPPPVGQPVADGSASGQGAPPPSRAAQFAAALAAAQNTQGAGLLRQPTALPDQPVTAGLSTGPGAGPEILPAPNSPPIGRFWRELSRITGDPFYAELADRARV
jgi:hypothetical protein